MSRYDVLISGNSYAVEVLSISGNVATVTVNGLQHQVRVAGPAVGSPAQGVAPAAVAVSSAPIPQPPPTAATAPAAAPAAACAAAADVRGEAIPAPMPGNIVNVLVKVGDSVLQGTTLLIMEAMKMENEINSPVAGPVVAVHVTKGQTVKVNQPLVVIGT